MGTVPNLANTFSVVSLLPLSSKVVFLAAAALVDFDVTTTFRATSRIVLFGTDLSDATTYRPKNFHLISVSNEGIGFAVWEMGVFGDGT